MVKPNKKKNLSHNKKHVNKNQFRLQNKYTFQKKSYSVPVESNNNDIINITDQFDKQKSRLSKIYEKTKQNSCFISLSIDLILLLVPIIYNIINHNYTILRCSEDFSSFPSNSFNFNGTMLNITIPYSVECIEQTNDLLVLSDSIVAFFNIMNYITIISKCERTQEIVIIYFFFSFFYIPYEYLRYSYSISYCLKQYYIFSKKVIINCKFFTFSDSIVGFLIAICLVLKLNESFYVALT